MNAFLRARKAFGFEYLISFRAEHNDADRDITGIEGLLFRNRLKKHRVFYEAVDAHARRRFKKKHRAFYEAVDTHARRRLKIPLSQSFSRGPTADKEP